ncbi:DUF4142 domain-containing protein [Streptomyces yerevanensis]|uniref:DUF4142 domain-containing protein n=1 Tax=Streptomyces yerevanensis TaxID=66378 RepID=UPI00068EFE62|nr:DUF4142 domain-containing protein [Streptomyces yerevanensis]
MHVKRWAPMALTFLALSGTSAASATADERPELPRPDRYFLRAAHQGNLAEIAAGWDARRHAATDCVKQAGAILATDHTQLDEHGRALADKLGVPLSGMLTATQRQELAAVKARAGTTEYDEAWLDSRRAAHKTALALIDQQLDSGSNPEVRAAARDARPVVARHLRMMRADTCRTESASASAPAAMHANSGAHSAADADTSGQSAADNREAILGAAALGSGGVLMVIGWRMAVAQRRSM